MHHWHPRFTDDPDLKYQITAILMALQYHYTPFVTMLNTITTQYHKTYLTQ